MTVGHRWPRFRRMGPPGVACRRFQRNITTTCQSIQSANFCTPYDNVTYKLSDLRGRLLSYGKASDTNSFYVPVTFEFDNKGAIIPGSFVEIYLLTAPMQNVISVPVSALIEEQGVYSVFVRVHEEAYKRFLWH